MHSRIVFFVFIFFQFGTCDAQGLTYSSVDSVSYNLLIKNDHKNLVKLGKEALKSGIDFYYLKLRLGISYFQKKNYDGALPHFERAFAMNPSDTLVQEYLYYSYLYSDRNTEAQLLADKFSNQLLQKINFKRPFFDFLSIGGGAMITNNISAQKGVNIKGGENKLGYVQNQGNVYFFNFSAQNTFGKRFRVVYGVSGFNLKSQNSTQPRTNIPPTKNTSWNTQYNLALNVNLKKGWMLGTAFGVYQMNYTFLSNYQDTTSSNYIFYLLQAKETAFMVQISLGKRMKYVLPLINFSYCNFGKRNQFQVEGTLVYYPLGNLKFYGVSSLAYIRNNTDNNMVFTQRIGLHFYKPLWGEAKFSFGNHQNYSSNSGFLTYNTPNALLLTAGIDFPLRFKHFEIIPTYRFMQFQEENFYLNSFNTFSTGKHTYFSHLISTTLKWNF